MAEVTEGTIEPGSPGPVSTEVAPDIDFDMVESALSFDPFESAEEDPSPDGGKEAKASPEPGTQVETQQEENPPKTGPVEPPMATEPEAKAPPEPTPDPELALLKSQVETLQTALKAVPQTPQPSAEKPKDDTPQYQFTIPTELMSLLDSENSAERQQGIGLLSQGVARTVHQTVMEQVGQIVQNQIPSMMQGMITQQTQAQTIFQDFYDKYPTLNRPELRQLIVSTGQQVMQESGAQDWSPTLRDAIAQRVLAIVGSGPTPAPTPTPRTVPAYVPNSAGARPGAPTGVAAEIADISDTLFG